MGDRHTDGKPRVSKGGRHAASEQWKTADGSPGTDGSIERRHASKYFSLHPLSSYSYYSPTSARISCIRTPYAPRCPRAPRWCITLLAVREGWNFKETETHRSAARHSARCGLCPTAYARPTSTAARAVSPVQRTFARAHASA